MPDLSLSTLDLFAVAAYIVVILAIGFAVSRRKTDAEGYFLAGRSLPWFLVGFSLFASNISSSTLVGLAGDGYNTGISVYNYEWFAAVVLVFFVIFVLPFYLRSRVYTMPEFLERRYDRRARYYFSTLTIVNSILLEIAGALYAGALVIKLLYPESSMLLSVAVLALLSGLYTAAGGLRAVVYTDALQAVVLLAGSVLVAVIAFQRVGSWEAVVAVSSAQDLSLVRPADDPFLPWPGLVLGLPLLGIYYWCNNQYIVQRALGARSLDHGRWGALFAGFLKLPVLFLMVMPGLFARVLYPELDQPNMVFPTLILDLLPVGIRGLVLVALVAAIMSSLDSTMNAVSTLVTMDFAKQWRSGLSERALVRIGRVATLVVMILGTLWAPQIDRFPSLFSYLQQVLAYVAPPVVAVFLVGLFWKRSNAQGAVAALGVGAMVAVLVIVTGFEMHFLYVAAALFGLCVVVCVLVSLAVGEPAAGSEDLVWTPAVYRAESASLSGTRWYLNYRLQALVLLVLTAILVSFFI